MVSPVYDALTLQTILAEAAVYKKNSLGLHVSFLSAASASATLKESDVWNEIANLNACISTRIIHGGRVEMPLEPISLKADPIIILSDRVFFRLSVDVPESVKAFAESKCLAMQRDWWLRSVYFWKSIIIAAKSAFPDETDALDRLEKHQFTESPATVEFHVAAFLEGVKFFLAHSRGKFKFGGFVLTSLDILLVEPSYRRFFKVSFRMRRIQVDMGKQIYSDFMETAVVRIKAGTNLRKMVYQDQESVARLIHDLQPIDIYYSKATSRLIKKYKNVQTSTMNGLVHLKTKKDIEVELLVFQWNPMNEHQQQQARELYAAYDYMYQNRYAGFLFIDSAIANTHELEIDNSVIVSSKLMFSLGSIQSVLLNDDEHAEVTAPFENVLKKKK